MVPNSYESIEPLRVLYRTFCRESAYAFNELQNTYTLPNSVTWYNMHKVWTWPIYWPIAYTQSIRHSSSPTVLLLGYGSTITTALA